jgi:glycosyltransferase involved in cell wall biosynthesis
MKIALYADVNMNLIDGSAIWLTSVVQILSSIPDTRIHLFLKAPVENAVNVEPLFGLPNLRVSAPELSQGQRALTPGDALELVREAHRAERFDAIFLRGLELNVIASDIPEFAGRLWVYFCDVPVDPADLTPELRSRIDRIVGSAQYLFVQTPQLRAHIEACFPRSRVKTRDLPPMVPAPWRLNRPLDPIDRPLRVVYSGQFKREYASIEMLDIFKAAGANFPLVEFHVFGEKIHNPADDPEFRPAVLNALETFPNLFWHKGCSRDQVLAEYPQMDVGWAWRTDKLEAHTLEISTKLLEFSSYGVPPIMARNRINASLFGEDYPLFANSPDEALERLSWVLRDPGVLTSLRRRVREVVATFQFEHIRTRHLAPLCRTEGPRRNERKRRLGIVGHDLKFLESLAGRFSLSSDIVKHYWWGHRHHDVKASEELAESADTIFCEWFLGNAVWYSKHKRPDQRLIVRFHRQELETSYPSEADLEAIDQVVVVSDHTRRDAISKFGWERHENKIRVIPNAIDCSYFNRPKEKGAQYNIGIVGITPRLKRLDLALDVLEKCRAKDERFKLFIKGKKPTDYAWLRERPDELAYFSAQMERIESDHRLREGVIFDGWGANMGEWYRKIGYILSVSDLEGTHQAVAEGGASGAIPILRDWEGANQVYRADWVCKDIDDMVERVLAYSRSATDRLVAAGDAVSYMRGNFQIDVVARQYEEII